MPLHDPTIVMNAIQTRRSFAINELTDAPVDQVLIDRVLEAANWAPSHGKTEPWRFVVFHRDGRAALSSAFGAAFAKLNPDLPRGGEGERAQAKRPWQAPVWIALGMQPSKKFPEWEDMLAFGAAVQNMHLMASALG